MHEEATPSRRHFMAIAAAGTTSLALSATATNAAAADADAPEEIAMSTSPAFQTNGRA
jgi:uncharacterized membrane protein